MILRCLLLLALLGACAPRLQDQGPAVPPVTPKLGAETVLTPDGQYLGLETWVADNPQAVIIALHGMNDYANAFAMPGPWWAEKAQITTYAYDQRGFGRSPQTGIWPGGDRLVDDLLTVLALVKSRHPDTPVFLLGDSMGGAVAIAAVAERAPAVEGLILVAPAVWGWSVQPFINRAALWLGAHLFPWKTFTGEGLEIWPSDNIEMLRGISRDPLVIKGTRTDAIYGLVTLMDRAYKAVERVNVPVLVLYGEKDEIIPRAPIEDVARRLCGAPTRVMIYPEGFHMVLRDLQGETAWADIAVWTADVSAPLPSGAEQTQAVRADAAACLTSD